MRSILLLAICACAFSAEVNVKPEPPKAEAPVLTVTDADLQNLAACARMTMKDLTPEQMQAVAIAIKHAEDDVQAMRKAKAVPVEVKGEKK